MDVPARAGLGRVDVAVRVDPEHAAGAVHRRKAAERAERDGVVAAEHERDRAGARLLDHLRRDPGAGRLDLGQEPRPLVLHRRRLRHRGLDVPVVAHRVAEAREALLEPGVADGRRPHVDAAPALPEVERRADDGDLACRAHRGNLTTLSRRGEVAQLVEHSAENRGVAGSSPALATLVRRRSARPPDLRAGLPGGARCSSSAIHAHVGSSRVKLADRSAPRTRVRDAESLSRRPCARSARRSSRRRGRGTAGPSARPARLGRRPARRHRQLPLRHPAVGGLDRLPRRQGRSPQSSTTRCAARRSRAAAQWLHAQRRALRIGAPALRSTARSWAPGFSYVAASASCSPAARARAAAGARHPPRGLGRARPRLGRRRAPGRVLRARPHRMGPRGGRLLVREAGGVVVRCRRRRPACRRHLGFQPALTS